MLQTYKAILRGDRVEWLGEAPQTDGGDAVHITVLEPAPELDIEERRRRVTEAMQFLASRNPFAEITDPVEWQREVRTDRPLPGRPETE